MFPLQWLVLVLVPLVAEAQPAPPNCCATKSVGGVSYTFVREDSAAISYSCLSSCVYERDDQPGTAFCFAQGDQQVVCGDSTQGSPRQNYMLYSWATMWSGECGAEEFPEFNGKGPCVTAPWDTKEKRDKLWCVCNRPGREIGTLLLYGIADTTDSAMPEGSAGCARDDVVNIRDTLREGHQRVEDIQIYALLSDGGEDAPEHKRMPSLLWYNRICAQTPDEKIDGVAVNNENYPKGTAEEKVAFLTNLSKIASKAGSDLKTHFSVSWNWFWWEPRNLELNGTTKNALQHMIDMFDSTDIQTAYVLAEQMVDRMQKVFNGTNEDPAVPGGLSAWSYAQSRGKAMYTTVYLSKDQCTTSFFPDDNCNNWAVEYHNEQTMWEQVDKAASMLPGFTPSLHYYGGVYASGGNADWKTITC